LANTRAAPTFAFVHSLLLAFGNEPPLPAHFFEHAIRHDLTIEPAQQAVE